MDALDTMPRIRLSDEQIKKIVAGKNKRGVHHRDRITKGDLAEKLVAEEEEHAHCAAGF